MKGEKEEKERRWEGGREGGRERNKEEEKERREGRSECVCSEPACSGYPWLRCNTLSNNGFRIHLDDLAVYPGPPPWKDALGHGSESSSGTSWKGQWRCLDCV